MVGAWTGLGVSSAGSRHIAEDPVGSVSVRQLEVSVSERCVSPRAELKKVTDFA